jgi:hypothetical protein
MIIVSFIIWMSKSNEKSGVFLISNKKMSGSKGLTLQYVYFNNINTLLFIVLKVSV